MVSVAITQLCPGVKAAVDNVQTNECGYVSVKLYL